MHNAVDTLASKVANLSDSLQELDTMKKMLEAHMKAQEEAHASAVDMEDVRNMIREHAASAPAQAPAPPVVLSPMIKVVAGAPASALQDLRAQMNEMKRQLQIAAAPKGADPATEEALRQATASATSAAAGVVAGAPASALQDLRAQMNEMKRQLQIAAAPKGADPATEEALRQATASATSAAAAATSAAKAAEASAVQNKRRAETADMLSRIDKLANAFARQPAPEVKVEGPNIHIENNVQAPPASSTKAMAPVIVNPVPAAPLSPRPLIINLPPAPPVAPLPAAPPSPPPLIINLPPAPPVAPLVAPPAPPPPAPSSEKPSSVLPRALGGTPFTVSSNKTVDPLEAATSNLSSKVRDEAELIDVKGKADTQTEVIEEVIENRGHNEGALGAATHEREEIIQGLNTTVQSGFSVVGEQLVTAQGQVANFVEEVVNAAGNESYGDVFLSLKELYQVAQNLSDEAAAVHQRMNTTLKQQKRRLLEAQSKVNEITGTGGAEKGLFLLDVAPSEAVRSVQGQGAEEIAEEASEEMENVSSIAKVAQEGVESALASAQHSIQEAHETQEIVDSARNYMQMALKQHLKNYKKMSLLAEYLKGKTDEFPFDMSTVPAPGAAPAPQPAPASQAVLPASPA
eukprot:TRINITY_DN17070_c0_g1_i1.p1 TRINITY_DN17070_c0_g1~~TRINITY_DN17070_c0_g1_i1.p1  ORF type:complete len:700 (+),score=185.48 TRINITY_DN17070_c0_g1_i1:202-2100(+)